MKQTKDLKTRPTKGPGKHMNKKSFELMNNTPIWKALLKMAYPALIFMFIIGSYMFADEILAINLVSQTHGGISTPKGHLGPKDTVRLFLSAFGPINPLLNAVAMLFGMGIATRVSINMGARKMDRAKNTLKTGITTGMLVAIILTPIILLTMKTWMRTQVPPGVADVVADGAFSYGAIIVGIFPITMFNQIVSSTLRTEGRNKHIMIPYVISIFMNLFLDWIFMGPIKMGIEGGALATMLSTLFVTVVFIIIIFKNKESILRLKNMFGLKFHVISLVGIFLVGMSPFLRNLAQSITGSIEATIIKDISHHIYGNGTIGGETKMTIMLSATFPVFLLFFPMIFAFAQAGRPIASFNYGAKNINRVKQTYLWVIIYATIIATLIYFISSFGLASTLMDWLGVKGKNQDRSIHLLKIMMVSVIPFGLVIASMVVLGSTDRIWISIFVSLLRGVILFFPFIYLFKYLAIENPSNEFLFWWFYPAISLTTTLISTITAVLVIRQFDKKVLTLDERLTKIYQKLNINSTK